MSERFDPQSHNALFATILAEMKADREERAAFRKQVLERFDAGTARMDAQDGLLAEIKTQTLKTNGRVTALETRWKVVVARVVGGATVITFLWQAFAFALEKGWIHLGT